MLKNRPDEKVLVAMSGGVDSSVAACLLKEQGFHVEGMTMPLTGFAGNAPADKDPVIDARRVCEALVIVHHEIKMDSGVQESVVEYFVNEYLKGRTPNPCVQCNTLIKFKALFDHAMHLGAGFFATGHYVRLHQDPEGFRLKKAFDRSKDQSYFLYGIEQSNLKKLLFPLGEMTKKQVRQIAEERNLPCSGGKESQDICFVKGDYKELLRQKAGQGCFVPGPFKNHEGRVVGEHQGIGYYTIGQRERLGIALGYPAYVYRISPDENTIYVGPRECLLSEGLIARNLKSLGLDLSRGKVRVSVKIRYNAADIPATVSSIGDMNEEIEVDFESPQEAVTPGQSVVFYDGDVVLGGAVIEKSF